MSNTIPPNSHRNLHEELETRPNAYNVRAERRSQIGLNARTANVGDEEDSPLLNPPITAHVEQEASSCSLNCIKGTLSSLFSKAIYPLSYLLSCFCLTGKQNQKNPSVQAHPNSDGDSSIGEACDWLEAPAATRIQSQSISQLSVDEKATSETDSIFGSEDDLSSEGNESFTLFQRISQTFALSNITKALNCFRWSSRNQDNDTHVARVNPMLAEAFNESDSDEEDPIVSSRKKNFLNTIPSISVPIGSNFSLSGTSRNKVRTDRLDDMLDQYRLENIFETLTKYLDTPHQNASLQGSLFLDSNGEKITAIYSDLKQSLKLRILEYPFPTDSKDLPELQKSMYPTVNSECLTIKAVEVNYKDPNQPVIKFYTLPERG